jgi:zinc D-Ala-D-Ala carboxypeptidase
MRWLKKRRSLISFLMLAVIITALTYLAWPNKAAAPTPSAKSSVNATSNDAGFNKQQYSTTDPASIWVVVNKAHPLSPIDYAPADLKIPSVPLRVPGNESMQQRAAAAGALEQMFAGAKVDGLQLMLSSGYRSYSYQVGLYNGYVHSEGQALADQQSARPGHSEHQTGLAADIEPSNRQCELQQCFADTSEGKWLAANAYKYGFILRYTPDKVAITGYESEPWHFRYVGQELAAEMQAKSITTLEEFFGISGGQSY